MLNAEQNKTLADAIVRVARHYPPIMTQKQQDLAAFCGTLITIGISQMGAYRVRILNERADQARNVTPGQN